MKSSLSFSILFILLLSVLSGCKTPMTHTGERKTLLSPRKEKIHLGVTALYTPSAVPFEIGVKPVLNFETLVSSDAKEMEENTKIQSQCLLALSELGYQAKINEKNCKNCTTVKLSVEFEDNGLKESTFLDCHPSEKGCTLFQKNYRKKMTFQLMNKQQELIQTIVSETTGRAQKVSDVAYDICKAGFEEFPEIRANKIYTIEK